MSDGEIAPDQTDDLKAVIAEMNAVLEGTGYSPPDLEPHTVEQLRHIVDKKGEVKHTWEALGQALEEAGGLDALRDRWRHPYTHHSNRLEMEGPLDESQTIRIAKKHQITDGQGLLDILGLLTGLSGDDRLVVGHDAAFQYALQLASELRENDRAIRQSDIRDLNRILETGKKYKTGERPGEYAKHQRTISRSSIDGTQVGVRLSGQTTDPAFIAAEMEEMCDWLAARTHLTEEWGGLIATVAHAWITRIHPFSDGNGRTARLLANLILAHGHWPPVVIKSSSDRPRYLDGLAESDEGGGIFTLYKLFLEVRERKMSDILAQPDVVTATFFHNMEQERRRQFERWTVVCKSFLETLETRLRGTFRCRIESLPDYSDYFLASQRKAAPRIWAMRIFSMDRESVGLIWTGYCSDPMESYILSKGMAFTPSIFFDVDGHDMKHWRSASDATSGLFNIDEISLQNVEQGNLDDTSAVAVAIRMYSSTAKGKRGVRRMSRGSEMDVVLQDFDTALDVVESALLRLSINREIENPVANSDKEDNE